MLLRKPDTVLGLDFETASACDIKLGSSAYANHETTRVMCASFILAKEDEALLTADWYAGHPIPDWVREWIEQGNPVLAHNVSFEHEVIKAGRIDLPTPSLDQWYDTMAISAAANLPQSLEKLSEALGESEKDMEGNRLMRKLCRLNSKGEHVTARGKVWQPPESDIYRLMKYCRRDVEAMLEAYFLLPAMTETERKVWVADQRVNERGVYIDLDFTRSLTWMADRRQFDLRNLTHEISDSRLDQPRGVKLRLYAEDKGIKLPKKRRPDGTLTTTLDREAMDSLLATDKLPEDIRKLLLLSKESGRLTSLAKLRDLGGRTVNGRLPWQLRYHGAHTGRWSAKGLQVHNMPKDRRRNKHTELVRQQVQSKDYDSLVLTEDNILESLSLCLRGVIAAPEGYEILGADYAAIEARVLPWLAFDTATLGIFQAGRDIYVEDAKAIGSDNRQLGKVQRLALGYGMGSVKFRETALLYGIDLPPADAVRIQQQWRKNNERIVQFWKELEDGFRELINAEPGTSSPAGRCVLRRGNERIVIELPSGRRLSYWSPREEPRSQTFSYYEKDGSLQSATEQVNTLVYFAPSHKGMGIETTYRGKLAENVTQAVARDLLAEALVRLDNHPTYRPVLHVHDAIAAEVAEGEGDIGEFCDIITVLPNWATGLPVSADGYRASYFKG